MNVKLVLIAIVSVIVLIVMVTFVFSNQEARISEIESRIDQIKQQALDSERYLSEDAYFDCRKEIPRYTSGLITSDRYYAVVDKCYIQKVENETKKLQIFNEEMQTLKNELDSLNPP